ncbi:MAG: DnaB-like helicase C-terminal domain-containing protein [Dictyoglomus thermophilum]
MHNIDLEHEVICGLLLADPEDRKVIEDTEDDIFYDDLNREIFKCIKEMHPYVDGKIDTVILLEKLKEKGIKGEKYLLEGKLLDILYRFVSPKVLPYHINTLKKLRIKRRLFELSKKIIAMIEDDTDLNEDIKKIEEELIELQKKYNEKKLSHIKEDLAEVYNNIGEKIVPIKTIKDIDEITGGINKGEFIIVGARPSVGKSALLINLAYILSKDKNIAFFSLEMSKKEIIYRLISLISQVPLYRLKTADISDEEMDRIKNACIEISQLNIYLCDNSSIKISEIYNEIKFSDVKFDIVFIDYLQLLQKEGKAENRVSEITKISRDIKVMARDLDIAIIVASQLNRNVENKVEKRPQLSDLRESGSLEQDADQVWLLFREDYYDKSKRKEIVEVEIDIAKNRNGKIGVVKIPLYLKNLKFG